VLATRLGLHLADWVITEAGFGFDLGAEKFFDIKCAGAGLDTAAVILVATVRALKMHGGVALADLARPHPEAVRRGLPNLQKHIENIGHFGEQPVVALNRFAADADAEVEVVRQCCAELGVPFACRITTPARRAGAAELARLVMEHAEQSREPFRPLYEWDAPVPDKIRTVAQKMYGARSVAFTKPPSAISPTSGGSGTSTCRCASPRRRTPCPTIRHLLGRPTDFDVTVRGIQINAGAGSWWC